MTDQIAKLLTVIRAKESVIQAQAEEIKALEAAPATENDAEVWKAEAMRWRKIATSLTQPRAPALPSLEGFAKELEALIAKHGQTLTDNQIITALERALDEALVLAGDPEATKVRRELIEALRPFAELGVGSGPDGELDNAPYRLTRGSIRKARVALAKAEAA